MKGVIFNLLESMVIDRFGDETMEDIYEEAEFSADAPPFIGPETYPDSDLIVHCFSAFRKIRPSCR